MPLPFNDNAIQFHSMPASCTSQGSACRALQLQLVHRVFDEAARGRLCSKASKLLDQIKIKSNKGLALALPVQVGRGKSPSWINAQNIDEPHLESHHKRDLEIYMGGPSARLFG
eukprot:1153059-Pelagomonas_calceolata.AAC.1